MGSWLASIAVLVLAASDASSALAAIQQATGRITFLRVHEMGSGYGPPRDQIDVEVVVQLDSREGMSFGFQLRNGPSLAAHQGMLDLLRDAFHHDSTVTLDFDIEPGRKNGILIRAALTKPALTSLVEVPNVVIASEDPASRGVLDPTTLLEAPPPPRDEEPSGGHERFDETRWEPVEDVELAAGASREFQVMVEAPALVLVHASWTGAAVPPTVRIARAGRVLASGSPSPVPPDQGSTLAETRVDTPGEVTVTVANPGPDPASLRVAVGVLPIES